MTHDVTDLSPYCEGKLNAELAQKGLVSACENPYPIGSIECREYERGVRDARPGRVLFVCWWGGGEK